MNTAVSDTPASDDIVDLLVKQHAQIRDLFLLVMCSSGEGRRESFEDLVRLLSVHEVAEEEIVHPVARRTIDGGEAIVEDRLNEERTAKAILAELEAMDTEDPRFLAVLNQLRGDVLSHARAEERYEFQRLRAEFGDTQRRGLAAAVRAAEAIAPTHPRPGMESPVQNLLAGPILGITDRVRDLIRNAMKP
jgi:hemerythrin superfamily protein